MNTLTPTLALMVFASVALAYLVLGITGFGSALIAVPLLLFVMPLSEAVPLVLFLDVVALVVFNSLNLQHVDWRIWQRMLPSIAVGIVCAALIVKFWVLPGHWLLLMLGAYVLWFGASKLRGELSNSPKPAAGSPAASAAPASFWSVFPFGWFAGVIEAWFGTCGPVVATGILRQSSHMPLFKATMAAIMLPAALMALSTYLVQGSYSNDHYLRALMLAPVAIGFVWLGNRLGQRVPQVAVRRAVFVLLCASGCVLIFKAMRALT